jgi:N-methylhydantoinase A
MKLDLPGAEAALAELGRRVGMDAYEVAGAAVRLVDALMTDAIRRVLSLAGADPRKLSLVAFGGMGGLHATSQARALGMRQVLIPRAAAGLSALGLLTTNHVVDNSRGFISPWQEVNLDHLKSLADELEALSLEELRVAGVPDEAIRLEWSLLLVYPGQTFDAVIPVDDPTDIAGVVEAAADLAARPRRSVVAIGEVTKTVSPPVGDESAPRPIGHRRI